MKLNVDKLPEKPREVTPRVPAPEPLRRKIEAAKTIAELRTVLLELIDTGRL